MTAATPKMIDPIVALVHRAIDRAGARPAALVAMDVGVALTGGLAVVETTRTFRNDEKAAIEALLSLPVPVHAAFFGLTAKIDGRILKGIAQAREEARETYEEAVSEGKTTVLHEELLRGVHALSVGNLAPGGTIEVTTRWADTLRAAAASCGRLRIPMTVGDVYGISGREEADELTHGEGLENVSLRIRHDAGEVRLASGALRVSEDGALSGEAPANAPIDIEVEAWKPGVLTGKAWDGRDVSLRMEPAEAEEAPVHAAALVDHSGSMGSDCEGDLDIHLSKHEAVRRGLRALVEELREADRISLWEFDNTCNPVDGGRAASPEAFAQAVEKLAPPRGGTEIGKALRRVFAETDSRDALLVTDGKSYALDVHRLAQEGRRVFVALVGEDSLEANVGHLAALTGGDIHFSFGADVESALRAALQGMRTERATRKRETSAGGPLPDATHGVRGNVRIRAAWSGEPAEAVSERDALSEGVAAYAASLALPSLSEVAARKLAVGESLVTHLTSLVLVDEDGPKQEGLPVTRKVDLPTPRTLGCVVYDMAAPPAFSKGASRVSEERMAVYNARPRAKASRDLAPPPAYLSEEEKEAQRDRQAKNLRFVAFQIDWKNEGGALAVCNLNGLDFAVASSLRALANHKDVREIATEWGIDPVRLAIALVAAWAAERAAGWDQSIERYANRVRRNLLKGVDNDAFAAYFRRFAPPGGG